MLRMGAVSAAEKVAAVGNIYWVKKVTPVSQKNMESAAAAFKNGCQTIK